MDKFKKINIIDGMPNELILEQLFDSPLKVRLLKLFLRNSGGEFSVTEIRCRARANGSGLTRELQKLLKIGFIKTKTGVERSGEKGEGVFRKPRFSSLPRIEQFGVKIIAGFKRKNAAKD